MTIGTRLQALLAEFAGDDRRKLAQLLYESTPPDLRRFSPHAPTAPVAYLDEHRPVTERRNRIHATSTSTRTRTAAG